MYKAKMRKLVKYLWQDEGIGFTAEGNVEGCDGTLRCTKAWLETNSRNPEADLEWLRDHGAYCDCEVLLNAADDA